MKLLKADMHATINYWYTRFQCISKKIEQVIDDNAYLRGVKCYLIKLQWEAELHHSKAVNAFGSMIDISDEHHHIISQTLPDCSSDSDSDSSSDDQSDDDE